MLDWIANNKVLFAGLGTATVAGVLGLIKYFFKKPPASTQAQRAAGNSVALQAGGDIHAGRDIVINPPPSQEPAPPQITGETSPPVLNMQPQDIFNEVNSRPLYQRDDAANHYIGVHLRVEGKLQGLHKREQGLVAVYLNCAPFPPMPPTTVTFLVSIEEYPELKFLHREADISVEGRIEEIDRDLHVLALGEARICRPS